MAVRITDGVPGSGKSYYVVNHLAKTYFEKQADGRYELVKDVLIITNIDDFQPPHLSLQKLLKESGGILEFFSEPFQKALSECVGKPIVYMIDEAQKLFRKGDRTLAPVYDYFEYHRHFGHDIYLITQNSKKLPPDIACLAEYIIHAAPRTRSVIGEFKYKWLDDGDPIKSEGLRPDQGIFALYKSMDRKESEKIKNPVMRTVLQVFALIICVFVGVGYYFKTKWIDPAQSSVKAMGSSAVTSSGSPASVGNSAVALASSTVHLRLSSVEYVVGSSTLVFLVFNGEYVPLDTFAYKDTLKRVMGSYYADVPASSIIPDKPESGRPTQPSEAATLNAGSQAVTAPPAT